MKKRITTTYIPQKLYEKLRVFAAKKQKSISQVMAEAVAAHIGVKLEVESEK